MANVIFFKKLPTINQIKQLLIKEAMKRTNGDQAAVAKTLGISKSTLKRHTKKHQIVRNLLSLFLVFICSVATNAEESEKYIKSQIVVRFVANTPQGEINTLIQAYGMTIRERIPQLDIYVLNFSPTYTVAEMVILVNKWDFVESCEPDYITSVQDIPNDRLFNRQWGLYNNYYDGADLHILEAWEMESGDPEIIISVIDMGYDISHEDLQDNLWHNQGEIPDNGIDDDNNGYVDDIIGWDFVNQAEGFDDPDCDWRNEDNDPTSKLTSHGNRVWGVIGATVNNEIGVAGVAGKCKIMLIRAGFHNKDGTAVLSSSHIAKGVVYSVENGARIINISSGSRRYSESYKVTLSYAIERRVLVVASAGNEGSNKMCYPAAYDIPGIISVGASTPKDEKAGFSNHGDWVDVSAPGQYIMTTLLNNEYGETQGTSFAAPMVSGVAGLLFSRYPDWTPSMVQDRIMNTVDVCAGLATANLTSGRINAYNALTDSSGDSSSGYKHKEENLFLTSGVSSSVSGCFISFL